MIFAAPPPRANKGSLDPATAIAVAATARSSFRECRRGTGKMASCRECSARRWKIVYRQISLSAAE
jgi:hypothetical protein